MRTQVYRRIRSQVAACVALFTWGCALLINGTTQTVDIESTPPGTLATFNQAEIIAPGKVTVRRKGWGVLRMQKEGYQPACKLLPSTKHPFLVVLDSIPAAIPLAIDLITGAIHNYPDSIRCALPPLQSRAAAPTLPSYEELLQSRGAACQQYRCDTEAWAASYLLVLTEVRRPTKEDERYSPTVARAPSMPKAFVYHDSSIEATIRPSVDRLDFRLRNLREHASRVIWDEAVFTDLDGTSHRVLHSGVRYSERNNSQVPSVVAPAGLLEDSVVPVNRVEFGQLVGSRQSPKGTEAVVAPTTALERQPSWYHLPLVPDSFRGCAEEEAKFKSRVKGIIGQNLSVLLPIEVGGVTNEYTFVFDLRDADLSYGVECIPLRSILGDVQIESGW